MRSKIILSTCLVTLAACKTTSVRQGSLIKDDTTASGGDADAIAFLATMEGDYTSQNANVNGDISTYLNQISGVVTVGGSALGLDDGNDGVIGDAPVKVPALPAPVVVTKANFDQTIKALGAPFEKGPVNFLISKINSIRTNHLTFTRNQLTRVSALLDDQIKTYQAAQQTGNAASDEPADPLAGMPPWFVSIYNGLSTAKKTFDDFEIGLKAMADDVANRLKNDPTVRIVETVSVRFIQNHSDSDAVIWLVQAAKRIDDADQQLIALEKNFEDNEAAEVEKRLRDYATLITSAIAIVGQQVNPQAPAPTAQTK